MSLLGVYKVENFWFCEVIYVTAILILEEFIQQRQNLEKKEKIVLQGKRHGSVFEICVCSFQGRDQGGQKTCDPWVTGGKKSHDEHGWWDVHYELPDLRPGWSCW